METGDREKGGVDEAIRRVWLHGEAEQAIHTWRWLRQEYAKSTSGVSIPRLPPGAEHLASEYQSVIQSLLDKALFRLSILGVIDDLTVEYGTPGSFKISIVELSRGQLDEALLGFADRIQPVDDGQCG